MKIEKKLSAYVEKALSQVDALGYQLDAMGVENQLNRHNLIAMAMFGQKRLEGELDSLSARAESKLAQVEAVAQLGKKYLESGARLVTYPAVFSYELIKSKV